MNGSEFVYDSVDELYYNPNKISLSTGESIALNVLYVPYNTKKNKTCM